MVSGMRQVGKRQMAAPEEQLEAAGLGVRKVEFNPGFSPRGPLLQSKTFHFSLLQFPFQENGEASEPASSGTHEPQLESVQAKMKDLMCCKQQRPDTAK